jgi:flagellar hook-associated protein 2
VLDIVDGASLQEQQQAGRPAQYEVNGSGITVDSATRTISITEGLTLTINKSSATPVDVTVARSTSGVSAALSVFTNSYNTLVAQLGAQRGQSGGPLAGDPLVGLVSGAISGIATYSSGGAVSGLRDLGLSLGADGKLTLNDAVLSAASLANPAGAATFLRDFLDAADAPLASLADPVSGLIKSANTNLQSQIKAVSDRIAAKQSQVDDLERRLTRQMAAADSLIASMEQKYSYMFSMFQAMRNASENQ